MALFRTAHYKSLEQLFEHQLQDLYDVETRFQETLPSLHEKSTNVALRLAFEEHMRETQEHAERLVSMLKSLDTEPNAETCEAMSGLLKEVREVLSAEGDDDLLDAAIIATIQRLEHYAMAGYGTARAFAHRLDRRECSPMLQRSLEEVEAMDRKLSAIAVQSVNPAAVAT